MKSVAASLLVLLLCSMAFATSSEHKFDMGTGKSPLWPGCTRVTVNTTYAADAGYGWQTSNRLRDCVRTAVNRAGKLAIPDDLWGDFIISYEENSFRVDLPNGRYHVVVLIGDIGSAYGPHVCRVGSLYPSSTVLVKANGREAIREVINENNILDIWYRNENTEYRKGDCPWEKYIDGKLRPRSFSVDVRNGRLILTFGRDCRIAGLFIHPLARREQFKTWYEAQKPARRKFFLSRYYEIQHKPLYPAVVPTDAERNRGYVVFSRSYLEEVLPNSSPAADERDVAFSISAARGEAEPVTFSMVPLKALRTVHITAGDLTSPGGGRIPASCWDIRHVRYMQTPRHSTADRDNPYSVKPRLLDKADVKDFEAGTVRRVWLTVRVPSDAVPGVYEGSIFLKPDNAPAATLPVKLRVLPFELEEPSDVAIGIFYNPGSPWSRWKGQEDRLFKDMRSSLTLLRDHGFNSVACHVGHPKVWIDKKDGKIKADMRRFERFFKLFKDVGMSMTAPFLAYSNDGGSALVPVQPTQKMGWIWRNGARADEYLNPNWVRRFRELLRFHFEYGKKRGWPPIVWCVHDELDYRKKENTEGIAKILQATYMQEPEVKTTGCINNPAGLPLVPYHDYPMFNIGIPFTQENLDLVRKHGRTLAIDNFGQNRWAIGFWMWRIQPRFAADSLFCWIGADPYNPFDDAVASELAVALPGRKGWRPSPTLERMREGIDDYKYAYTLQQTLQKAKADGAARGLIKRGEGTLKHLHDFVDTDLRDLMRLGLPAREVMDGLRRRIAGDIAALHGVDLPAPPPRLHRLRHGPRNLSGTAYALTSPQACTPVTTVPHSLDSISEPLPGTRAFQHLPLPHSGSSRQTAAGQSRASPSDTRPKRVTKSTLSGDSQVKPLPWAFARITPISTLPRP